MNFWIGLVIGLIVGGFFSIMSLVMARTCDDDKSYEEKPLDKSKNDGETRHEE